MFDVNVLRAPGDVQSDHHLVVCKVKVKGGWPLPGSWMFRPIGTFRSIGRNGTVLSMDGSVYVRWDVSAYDKKYIFSFLRFQPTLTGTGLNPNLPLGRGRFGLYVRTFRPMTKIG